MQLTLAFEQQAKYDGTEPEIDWDTVSGLDLAGNLRLLARWMASPTRRNEDDRLARFVRRSKQFQRPTLRGANPPGIPGL